MNDELNDVKFDATINCRLWIKSWHQRLRYLVLNSMILNMVSFKWLRHFHILVLLSKQYTMRTLPSVIQVVSCIGSLSINIPTKNKAYLYPIRYLAYRSRALFLICVYKSTKWTTLLPTHPIYMQSSLHYWLMKKYYLTPSFEL